MKIPVKIIFIAVAATLIGVGVYTYGNRVVNLPSENEIQTGENKVTKENEVVSINVSYPTIPGDTAAVGQANELIVKGLDRRIEDFEKEAQGSATAEIGLPKEIKSTVTGGPSVEEKNIRYVAIFMGMEWYLRGAAHPWHTIDTYVFDYAKGKLVSIDEMFRPGVDYVALLSQYSYQDLLAQSKEGDIGFIFDESMVREGTKPIKENFSRILPIKDGLMIYFTEYQVAPYAAGPQQVVIPYAKLKDVINPEGVLGMYIK